MEIFQWPSLIVTHTGILFLQNLFTVKAELPQEGILFRTQFPSLGIFISKKVGNRKN